MIAKKIYLADGTTNRFLSDIIIRSVNFARPYAYVYDDSLPTDGSGDVLQNPLLPRTYPTNLYKRGENAPKSEDLVTVDKWQVVDNSILFFTAPLAPATIWVEVATTAEEFGDTLTQPSVRRAEEAAETAEAQAAISTANAVATSADAVTTNADVVITNANANTTTADVIITNANAATTNADVVITNADVVITNADAITSTTAANNASTSESNALASEIAAGLSEVAAASSAAEASISEAEAAASALEAKGYADSLNIDEYICDAPILSIANTVNEGASIVGTLTVQADSTPIVSADKGTISNLTQNSTTNWTFTYTGQAVDIDESSIVSCYCTTVGYFNSPVVTEVISVLSVPLEADTSVTFNFATDTENNEGFE